VQKSWADDARQQLAELINGFQKTTADAGERWQQNLSDQQQQNTKTLETLEQRSQQSQHQLLEQLEAWATDITRQQQSGLAEQQKQLTESAEHIKSSSAELVDTQKAGVEQLVTTIGKQLSELREQEAGRADASAARMESLETTVTKHLAELGTALEAPMTRLIETASETPKAAAEVIRQLQSEIARNSERENELLEERQRLVQELDSLLENQRRTADNQRDAVDSLINGAGETLTGISERFNTLIQEQSQQLGKLGDHITGSSQEVGALSDAFAQAIELFSQSNQQVIASLTDIQKALDNAGTRHDEQLAYYVAQAREVIDLSVSAQKDVIDAAAALRQAEPSEAG
jgi:DNA repair exonuclease SbcCD ATPase subunit